MTLSPQFSIDLDAELHKITQRQHLNDVHYLVALVRHGLAHKPDIIHIESEKNRLIFAQDGRTLEVKEWEALLDLLKKVPHAEESQQMSLNLLETVFGVALLSIFLRFESVSLTTGHLKLQTRAGQLVGVSQVEITPGYRLVIERSRTHRNKEETELQFYCSGSRVPIFYNQSKINRPLKLEDHLLALDFQTEQGHGSICIPASGELSRFYFFKAGIRIGVKTFSPDQGRIVEGFWNVSNAQFESLYQQTIQTGQPLLESHTQAIYQAIPKHFHGLAPSFKERLKRILMGMDPLGWAADFGKIPLFANTQAPFALCLKDILGLRANFEVIPFLGKPKAKTPLFVPLLSGEDQYFLGHRLNLGLRPLVGQLETPKPRQSKNTDKKPQTISSNDLQPAWKSFLFALNQHRLPMRFWLTHEASGLRERANGYRDVWLCKTDADVKQAFEAYCQNPQTAHQWRYRFLAQLSS